MIPRNTKILAVIPARAGSKRLPGKNLKQLAGLPLIAWTIRTALEARVFKSVLVSTDDPKIASIATEHGASVPWLRPSALSTDTATSVDVVLHALSKWDSMGSGVDSVMLLQPTSPFRSVETIQRAIELHEQSDKLPVVSVCPAKAHPAWCFQVDSQGRMRGYVESKDLKTRSQDLTPAYQLTGSIYLATSTDLHSKRSFLGPNTRALVISHPAESIDIDDDWDWQLAKCIADGHYADVDAWRRRI